MQYAFDLDGTLADTREAVLTSYRAVGVEPPLDFYGKTWKEWLNDATLHHRKNAHYIAHGVKLVKPTKMVELMKLVDGFVITGASAAAAEAVLEHIGLPMAFVYPELTKEGKAQILNTYQPGIVFEDSLNVALYLRENTKWTVCHVL